MEDQAKSKISNNKIVDYFAEGRETQITNWLMLEA